MWFIRESGCENQDSALREIRIPRCVRIRIRLCVRILHIDTVYSRRYISDFLET